MSCHHDWQIISSKRHSIFQKHSLDVEWKCSKCRDTHTTLADSRIDRALWGPPGVVYWEELNAMWELEFGKEK